jgi:hypothetical protein
VPVGLLAARQIRKGREMKERVETVVRGYGSKPKNEKEKSLFIRLVPERNRTIAVRESGSGLPAQFFWDWLSGVRLDHSEARLKRTPLMHVIDAFGGFLFAVAIGHFALRHGGWWLLLLIFALPLAVGRARKCHMTIVHQAVHDQLFQIKNPRLRKWANRWVADVLGVVFWLPDYKIYRAAHAVSHHNSQEIATPRDVDGREVFMFGKKGSRVVPEHSHESDIDTATPKDAEGKEILRIGFLPGKPREYYWSLLWRTFTSPVFYLSDMMKRLRYSLFIAPWYRRFASGFFICGIIALTWLTRSWPTFVIFYLLPVFPLFRLSGVLQQLSEHMWGTHMNLIGSQDRLPLVCQGRFLFDEVPSRNLGRAEWRRATALWWMRVLYHLLMRVCVLCGDLQLHHDHHLNPRSRQWTSASHACSKRMKEDMQQQYTHTWSMGEALDRVFKAMAAAPPLDQEWLDELDD